jgi:hypothetical protein
MNKGQVFSIDFILAISIAVLFLGVIVTLSETKMYSQKEDILSEKLIKQTDAGLVALLNGKYSCKLETGINLANSLDLNLFNQTNTNEIKKYLGLNNKKVTLIINNENTSLDEITTSDEIIILDQNILLCDGNISVEKLNNCINNTTCDLNEVIINFWVSQ